MSRISLSLVFLLGGAAAAETIDEWEIPAPLLGDLAKPCPDGTRADGKGFCLPAPKPAAVETKPATSPEAPPTPEARPLPSPATPAPSPTPAPAPASASTPASAPASAAPAPAPESPPVPAPAAADTAAPAASADLEKQPAATGEKDSAAAPKGEEPKKEPPPPFIKGELSNFIGSAKLITKNDRIGVGLGWRLIDGIHYFTINPEVDFRFGELAFGLGGPLSIELFDTHTKPGVTDLVGFENAGSLRKQDWNEASEFARIVRYLSYGRKEDRFYFSLSQNTASSLGHGALLRRYSVNIDPDSTRLAAQLDAYTDYFGFEFMTNSVTSWDVVGTLAFIKPLSFFMEHPVARSLSIGFSYVADRHAPVLLAHEESSPGVANPWRVAMEGSRPVVSSDAFLHGMGIDVEVKVLKTDTVDLKPYADFSWMMPGDPGGAFSLASPEGGNGFTLGLLGRFNVGRDPVHAFRTVAEFRTFSATYLPGYFDTFYEIQKFMWGADFGSGTPKTKFQQVFVDRRGQDRRLGFYLEFNYAILSKLGITLALEGSNADRGSHFLAHLEVPALEWLQFFATYHQTALLDMGDLFSGSAGDKILFSALRLKLLPFLFVNFRYFHTFQLADGYADYTGDGIEEHYRHYAPANVFQGDVEFGYEF